VIENHLQVSAAVKGFAEQVNLEKYHDIYDISDFDISDAMRGFSEKEFDDPESLRSLKIAAARFHIIRKILLCSLLAFEAAGDNTDFLRWSTAVEGLKILNDITTQSFEKVRQILSEEESKRVSPLLSRSPRANLASFPYDPGDESSHVS
jgi:hypothetical protein